MFHFAKRLCMFMKNRKFGRTVAFPEQNAAWCLYNNPADANCIEHFGHITEAMDNIYNMQMAYHTSVVEVLNF